MKYLIIFCILLSIYSLITEKAKYSHAEKFPINSKSVKIEKPETQTIRFVNIEQGDNPMMFLTIDTLIIVYKGKECRIPLDSLELK